MNYNQKKVLINLGLSEKEAAVYLSSLALGPTTVAKIAQHSKINRTTIYPLINSLQSKGLFSLEIRAWKKFHVAKDPKQLKILMEDRKRELEEELPNLLSLYNFTGNESSIKYYEGIEAVKSIYLSLLKSIKPRESYLVIADIEKWINLDKRFFQKFIEKRGKLNIDIKLILQDSQEARVAHKNQKNFNTQVKLLNKDNTFSANIIITPQKTIIQQLVPPIMAIIVENKNIISMYQDIFYALWERMD